MLNNNITETFAATLSLSERRGDEDESSNEISIISLNKDIIILLASYLNAQDMLRLALCCKRFGKRDEAYDHSLMEEAAMRQLSRDATEEQMTSIPRSKGESWIGLYSYKPKKMMHGER